MGCGIAEAELCLAGAHLVGERSSSRYHDDRASCRHDGVEPRRELRRAHDAAAELDDHGTGVGGERQGFGSLAQGGIAHPHALPLPRLISTPTAPGSLSSFSILTVTADARG